MNEGVAGWVSVQTLPRVLLRGACPQTWPPACVPARQEGAEGAEGESTLCLLGRLHAGAVQRARLAPAPALAPCRLELGPAASARALFGPFASEMTGEGGGDGGLLVLCVGPREGRAGCAILAALHSG